MIWNGNLHFEDEEKRRIPSEIRDMLVKVLCVKMELVIVEFQDLVDIMGTLDQNRQRQLLERFEELYGQEKEKNNFS